MEYLTIPHANLIRTTSRIITSIQFIVLPYLTVLTLVHWINLYNLCYVSLIRS